jgi:flagellar protein FlaG
MDIGAIKATGATSAAPEGYPSGNGALRPTPDADDSTASKGAAEQTRVSREEVVQAVKELNEAAKLVDARLRFHIDKSSKRVVIEVVDETSGEVLRQIPPEVLRRLSQALGKDVGLLVDKRA